MVELKKILYIDTETGGVDFQNSALIQLSGIIEIDGIEQERFNFYVKPFGNSIVTDEALQVQGRTFADLATDKYIDEKIVYRDFVAVLDKYIDKYDKTDKFLVAGFNVNFDINMIKALFLRNHNSFLYSYIESASFVLDPMQIVTFLQEAQVLPKLANNKLGTLCEYFNIKFEAHDSMEDIIATKALIKVLLEKLSRCRG